MTESISTSPTTGDSLPPWMMSVNEETLYNADHGDSNGVSDENAPATPDPEATSREDTPNASESPTRNGSLEQRLALTTEGTASLSEPDPDLQPTTVGHVRRDLDQQFEKAVSVLGARYGEKVSRTLVLEFALYRTLHSLHEEGEDSPLVQWLDSTLPRS